MSSKLVSHNSINKQHIAKTIALLYHPSSEVPPYLRKILLVRLIWAATEQTNNGKYRKYFGQPRWSRGAIEQLIENKEGKALDKTIKLNRNLIHEHAVPKKVIMDRIEALKTKSYRNIYKILEECGHAVVVNTVENIYVNEKYRTTMPLTESSSKSVNAYSRYAVKGIKVYDVSNYNLQKLTVGELRKLLASKPVTFSA